MNISPDSIAIWKWGPITVNETLRFTWLVMWLLVLVACLATRKLSIEPPLSRWQNFLEIVVSYMRDQVREITSQAPDRYLPFLGTLFLFIAVSNVLSIIPGYIPPTGSLYTTSALAICVFFAVPIYGITQQGLISYLKRYVQPSVFVLPFNIIGELSRTLALAIRLFGNIMSGTLVVGVLVSIAPLFFPIIMQGFGLLVGVIQAYIFFVLATVYIGSAARAEEEKEKPDQAKNPDNPRVRGE
jgi:F-type H+-transporting ATPase subunit a